MAFAAAEDQSVVDPTPIKGGKKKKLNTETKLLVAGFNYK